MRALWTLVSVSFAADRRNSILLCLALPLGWLAPTAGAVAAKVLVDAATRGDYSSAILAGALAAVNVVLTLGSRQLVIYLVHALGKKADAYLQRRLAELVTGLPGIEHHERPDYLDQVQLLRQEAGMIGAGLNAAVQLAAACCQVVVVCGLLAAQVPWLLLLVPCAVPSFAASTASRRLTRRASEHTAEPDRLIHKLINLTGDVPAARETRLLGLAENLTGRRRALMDAVNTERDRALIIGDLMRVTGRLIFGLGYLGAVVLVLRQALHGHLTAGDVTMVIVLAGQVEGLLGNLVGGVQLLVGALQAATRMRWLESYDRTTREHRPPGDLPAPLHVTAGIRLERLTFSYPGTNRPVLDDVSATLPAGSVIAIVGENGAGKTSLIKLLLGLYQPTAGQIVIDDTDLARIDIAAWRARCSTAFQDHCRLEFLTHQAIGVGEPDRMNHRPTLSRAVQAAGAAELIDALPDQLDTQLGATWDRGIDLSGGQWQRIALARSRMRDSPVLLVLDEPTAALDAETEHALFERFATATHDSRSPDSITVLVTHRFSTVRMADLILVLDGGRIAERGTHNHLMTAGGLYADLYQLQARAYR